MERRDEVTSSLSFSYQGGEKSFPEPPGDYPLDSIGQDWLTLISGSLV